MKIANDFFLTNRTLMSTILLVLLVSACTPDQSAERTGGTEKTSGIATKVKDDSTAKLNKVVHQAVPALTSAADATDEQRKLGKRSFLRCRACHSLAEGEAHRVGPNLHGLFGARVAKKEGFNYSEALTNSDLTWSSETLYAWLKSPSTYIPGNIMAFIGVADDKELESLLIYLEENTR